MGLLAIIPARSGSKGLKDKNIKQLCGKPLLAYTIEAAVKSGIFDCIHVSTDSAEYAEIARRYGADVPFLRTQELSSDKASSWDAVRYVIKEYKKQGKEYDTFMLLQPTTPLRRNLDIKAAYELFQEKKANAVISVCQTDHSPLCTDIIAEDGNMKGFVQKQYRDLPRQELPIYYRVNGAIYLMKKEVLLQISELFDQECYAYIMDKQYSVDIDDEIDFIIAEAIMKNRMERIEGDGTDETMCLNGGSF